MGSTRCRQRLSRPLPDDALAVTKRKRLGNTERRSYTPLMWGIQAERTVSVPRRRMSESASELLTVAIFLRKSGRSS